MEIAQTCHENETRNIGKHSHHLDNRGKEKLGRLRISWSMMEDELSTTSLNWSTALKVAHDRAQRRSFLQPYVPLSMSGLGNTLSGGQADLGTVAVR
jgi:hypothetical protein